MFGTTMIGDRGEVPENRSWTNCALRTIMSDIAQKLCVETGENHWQSVGNKIIFVLLFLRMLRLP
jgi:hypothetical protein